MRMLVILLLVLNITVAAYFLVLDPRNDDTAAAPDPGPGTLQLVSEARGPQPQSSSDDTAKAPDNDCWRSGPLRRGAELKELTERLRELGYQVAGVYDADGGFAVRLATAATIQEAAERLEDLTGNGIEGLRVRRAGQGRLLIVAGPFETRAEADAHAGSLRERGVEAPAVVSERDRSMVRVVVRAPAEADAPGRHWRVANCQPGQP